MKIRYFARMTCEFDDCTSPPLEVELPMDGGNRTPMLLVVQVMQAALGKGWLVLDDGGLLCRFHAELKAEAVQ